MEYFDRKSNRTAIWLMFSEVAELVGMPVELLYSLGQTESGRYLQGKVYPWPWTVCADDKRQFYDNRGAMYGDISRMLELGPVELKVGALQLDLKRHADNRKASWELTNPFVNLEMAASFLKRTYQQSGNWWSAIAEYHGTSGTLAERIESNDFCDKVKSYMSRNRLHQPQSIRAQQL